MQARKQIVRTMPVTGTIIKANRPYRNFRLFFLFRPTGFIVTSKYGLEPFLFTISVLKGKTVFEKRGSACSRKLFIAFRKMFHRLSLFFRVVVEMCGQSINAVKFNGIALLRQMALFEQELKTEVKYK
ncbi:MAG: hypothetical protein HUJ55_00075 [Ileibacterium sp.]|nr:hypothetical protein [Ileibacterium sp.]